MLGFRVWSLGFKVKFLALGLRLSFKKTNFKFRF